MAKLIIQNLYQKEVLIPPLSGSILYHIQQAQIDWMHACGGKGRCTTCKIRILSGEQHLNELTPAELKFKKESRLKEHERLSCQSQVLSGEVVIRIPDEYKLPHLHYSEE